VAAPHSSCSRDGLDLKVPETAPSSFLFFGLLPNVMSLNGLTVSAGLKLVPLVLETLVKHYFERLKATPQASATTSSDGVVRDGKHGGSVLDVNLRQEDLLYDQTFTVAKVSIAHVSSSRLGCSARIRGLRGPRVLIIRLWLRFAITCR